MAEPSIAVVIPAYNASRFLPEAIESVRSQTLVNLECVIVDDGSTDGTPRLLESIRDPRIRSVRQENLGEREARLRGFLDSKAAKIVFLDADDRLLTDTLARFTDYLDRYQSVDVVYGERSLIGENGQALGPWGGAILNKHPRGDILESILIRPFLSTPSQACLRRTAVPPVELQAGRSRLGDWVLLAASALNSSYAYLGKPPVVEYRIHAESRHRGVAGKPGEVAGVEKFDEVLDALFSLPGLEDRFSASRISQMRREAGASCLAILGQEFIRRREYKTARDQFRAALGAGSRDVRDLLCFLATFTPLILRWAEPLYGVVSPNGQDHGEGHGKGPLSP